MTGVIQILTFVVLILACLFLITAIHMVYATTVVLETLAANLTARITVLEDSQDMQTRLITLIHNDLEPQISNALAP